MGFDNPALRTPVFQQAVAGGDLGTVVRLARQARGLSQTELGVVCGYSHSQISRMETGARSIRDVTVLRGLATALGIPPRCLGLADDHDRRIGRVGEAGRALGLTAVPETPAAEGDDVRRRALLTGIAGLAAFGPTASSASPSSSPMVELHRALLYPLGQVEPLGLEAFQTTMRHAYRQFTLGAYTELGRLLPRLLDTAHATATAHTDSRQHGQAHALLAATYDLATQLAIKLDHDGLAYLTADRARTAAGVSGSSLAEAASARMMAIVVRRAGYAAEAQDLILRAANQLDRDSGARPAERAMMAALYSTAAYTAAQAGDRARAVELISDAERAAVEVAPGGDMVVGWGVTPLFTRPQARLYQVGIHYSLGDAGRAIEIARGIQPMRLPTPERQGRYWIDVARAFNQWGKADRCFQALVSAYRVAPSEVRDRPRVQTLVRGLLNRTNISGLREFAEVIRPR